MVSDSFKPPAITDEQRKRIQDMEPRLRLLREDLQALEEAGVDVSAELGEIEKHERLRVVLLDRFNPRRRAV